MATKIKSKYLKLAILFFVCQIMFGSMAFKVEASLPTITVDNMGGLVGSMIKQVLEQVVNAASSAAKNMLIKSLANEINGQIGGSSGDAKFITDWRDALKTQPDQATDIQMKTFFNALGGGKDGNYVATDGSSGYVGNILGAAQKSVTDTSIPQVINMAEMGVNDPSQIFNQNNMRAFMSAYGSSGKVGNAGEAMLLAQDARAKFDETNKRLADTQAIANGGFYSSMANGKVITPGATIRDLVASTQEMPFQSLANAKSIGEVIGGLVSRTVSNNLKKGIGSIKQDAQKSAGSTIDTASNALKGSFGDLNKL